MTLTYGRWDSHGDNEGLVRHHGTRIDQAVAALVNDLEDRGMLDNVTVLVWGEFGRTPRINPNGGRDHWTQVSCAYMAGGGMKNGQAIGSTNRLGEHAHGRPVHVQEIFATLYLALALIPVPLPLSIQPDVRSTSLRWIQLQNLFREWPAIMQPKPISVASFISFPHVWFLSYYTRFRATTFPSGQLGVCQ